jgi:alpha-1,2-mannosyltransferase
MIRFETEAPAAVLTGAGTLVTETGVSVDDTPGLRRVTRRHMIRLAILATVVAALTIAIPGRKGWFDIGVYHDAVTYWVNAPGHLYDFISPGTPYGFTYPPFAAVCMLPMSLLGWHTTIAINVVVGVCAAAFIVYVLVDPIAQREGWHRGYAFAVAACLFALPEPVRDTVGYGQINLVLVALVYADMVLLKGRFRGFAGIGTGLAAAIKLTPGIFILYFVLTGRWRAAAFSAGTMITATAIAAVVAPGATLTYFAHALWDTNRIGVSSYVSNQSLMGVIARLNPAHPNRLLWLVLALIVMCTWAWRVRASAGDRNDRLGFALTGLTACLISPISWVHHLVWILPGLIELTASALLLERRRSRRRLRLAVLAYLLLSSDIVWIWWKHDAGVIGFFGSNLYVLISLGLLFWLPIRIADPARPARARIPAQLVRAARWPRQPAGSMPSVDG